MALCLTAATSCQIIVIFYYLNCCHEAKLDKCFVQDVTGEEPCCWIQCSIPSFLKYCWMSLIKAFSVPMSVHKNLGKPPACSNTSTK